MKPEYFADKGMAIDGNFWQIHPKTGKAWTKTSITKFINDYQEPDTSPNLEALKKAAVITIKLEAAQRIMALAWQLQRGEERVSRAALGGTEQSDALEQAENALLQVFNAREAIRQASNEAEVAVNALDDAAAVEKFEW
ncbi:MAG: PhoPQ-activated pathogenicity-related protein [Phenylobacterium sp.]|jgi:PhoPQ-activated pathogenicity-related protein